jgi:Fe-S-cluster containining protein
MKKPIPLLDAPGGKALVECTQCGKCCTYVSIEINEPTKPKYATDALWYLYHDKVSLYVDGDGEWSVVFETRCRNLQSDLLCAVYAERPHICRDFDNTCCDVNDPEGGRSIDSPEQFLAILKAEYPKVYRKIEAQYVPASIKDAPPQQTKRRRLGVI